MGQCRHTSSLLAVQAELKPIRPQRNAKAVLREFFTDFAIDGKRGVTTPYQPSVLTSPKGSTSPQKVDRLK